jgi:hypothetical protein
MVFALKRNPIMFAFYPVFFLDKLIFFDKFQKSLLLEYNYLVNSKDRKTILLPIEGTKGCILNFIVFKLNFGKSLI